MAFCDFCPCLDCLHGTSHLSHSKVEGGKWVCDVCWRYEICMDTQRKETGKHNGPCDDIDCSHRPKLVGDWIRFKE